MPSNIERGKAAQTSIIAAERGSIVQTTHTTRKMKAYCIYENELSMISDLNTETAALFSFSGSIISFGISALAGAWLQWDSLSASTKTGLGIGAAACVILAIVAAIWGNSRRTKRNSLLDEIKRQTEAIDEAHAAQAA